jgi:hypothetical protein
MNAGSLRRYFARLPGVMSPTELSDHPEESIVRLPSRLVFVFVCLLICAPVWAQVVPPPAQLAYVSTGTSSPSQIYSIDTVAGTTTLLVSTGVADYEGLVVLPDNAPADNPRNSPAVHSFLVYACDTANGKIIRFDPASPGQLETVYSANAALQHPQCGRGTSSGDLIVTDTGSGSGWWKFPGIANIAFNSAGTQTPFLLKPATGLLEGTAVKNIGDLLIVDHAGNQVFRSPAPAYTGQSTFISSGLTSPFGIAKRSDGQTVYVSNQTSKPFIASFGVNANGTASPSCSNVTIKHASTVAALQMSPGDTLYVAGSTAGGKGALFSFNATASNGCLSGSNMIGSFAAPLVGVALALPDFSATQTVTATAPGPVTADFGYAALEVTQTQGTGSKKNPFCTVTVTATPTPPAFLTNVIAPLQNNTLPLPPETLAPGSQGAADLGWDGFEIVLTTTTATLSSCESSTDGAFHYLLGNLVSQVVGSPQVVSCAQDNTFTDCEVDTQAAWTLGGILPSDISMGGSKSTKACPIFLVNAGASSEPGFFCGYQSPLTNTFNPATGMQDPSLATSVSGGALPVKFRLAHQGQACSSTNVSSFISDDLALLSLEQVCNTTPSSDSLCGPGGSPVFVPMQILSSGGSSPAEPLFKVDGNKNHNFALSLGSCTPPSGVTGPCPAGIYALTTAFLGNNTATTTENGFVQSIYTFQTTLFVLP